MAEILYRWMEPIELAKLRDIDRAEQIRTGYRFANGELQQMDVNWDSPPWSTEGDGDYTVAAQVRFCQDHLARGGKMVGAFDGPLLVGIGIIQPEIEEGTAQLAYLHVSSGYRKRGIAERVTGELVQEAKQFGAVRMYVSATPSGSAIGFYLSQGFRPTDQPIQELYELEPDDIHMLMQL